MRLRGWSVLSILFFCLTQALAQDQSSSFQQEKSEIDASSAAKLFPANIFKKIEGLQSQSKQTKDADRAQLLLQQGTEVL